MLHVVVTMMVKEGRMEEFLAMCAELRPQVLQEPGCLAYDYARDAVSPLPGPKPAADRITLLERWESPEALKAHLETKHMKAMGPRMNALRASVEVKVFEGIFA